MQSSGLHASGRPKRLTRMQPLARVPPATPCSFEKAARAPYLNVKKNGCGERPGTLVPFLFLSLSHFSLKLLGERNMYQGSVAQRSPLVAPPHIFPKLSAPSPRPERDIAAFRAHTTAHSPKSPLPTILLFLFLPWLTYIIVLFSSLSPLAFKRRAICCWTTVALAWFAVLWAWVSALGSSLC